MGPATEDAQKLLNLIEETVKNEGGFINTEINNEKTLQSFCFIVWSANFVSQIYKISFIDLKLNGQPLCVNLINHQAFFIFFLSLSWLHLFVNL